MTVPIYVISNGDLVKATFDAAAIILNSETFNTAIKLATVFAVFGTSITYIRGRDIAIFFRWFVIYFAVATVMLGPKMSVQIIDSTNPGAVYKVDNIPYGLAYPASLITSTTHGLVIALEEAYHMPDDFAYNKTGMLFGSKLFGLSTEFHIVEPSIKSELSEYVKNCVLGDILINKKYSMGELTNSKDLMTLLASNPSPRRGLFIEGKFCTCKEAVSILKGHINSDITDNGFKYFGKRIFGGKDEAKAAQKLQSSLAETYQYYAGISNSALQLMTQNVLINGIRDGVLNYTSETGAAAAFLNLSTTQAMERMRMSWATSRNMAAYILPIMHTDILLMLFCLFPIIVLLTLQPSFGFGVFKNYIYSILWVESWPILFACLNLTVSFYVQGRTASLAGGGLTLSNIDLLALEHSDVANMAGYLMMTIPFIAGSLVTGMAYAFNTAASYIGGALQSSATSAASEVASGSISLGNASWGNVNANKFDTNSTLMQGMTTEQLKSGVLHTTTSEDKHIYDSSHAFSKLPVNVRASDMLSESVSSQAEAARSASIQDQKSHDQSISNVISDMNSFGESFNSSKSHGEGFSSREAASSAQSASDMKNIATTIAKRNHVDVNDVYRGLVNFSQGGEFNVNGSLATKALGINIADGKIGFSGKIGLEHTRSNESSTHHSVGRNIDVTAEEANRFSNDLHKVQEYSKTHHTDTNHSAAESQLFQLSTNLNKAQTASENYSVHKAESERLSNVASIIKQHSAQIDSDLSQEIAEYAIKTEGREQAEVMFGGKDRARLETVAKNYIHSSGVEDKILSNYQHNSIGVDPDQKAQAGQMVIDTKKDGIIAGHEHQSQNLVTDAKSTKVELKKNAEDAMFKPEEFKQTTENIGSKYNNIDDKLKKKEEDRSDKYNTLNTKVTMDIKSGIEKSRGTTGDIKPDFAKK